MCAAVPSGADRDAVAYTAYGGFLLGGMQLALPMDALREVVPLSTLHALPCPASSVIGGIDLRGVVVPVVDLRIVLGREPQATAHPSVIIMVHDGRILGLLAEGVTGIFRATNDALHPVQVGDPVAAAFAGSLQRAGDDVLVSVLSPAALAAWPAVPMVVDPEPARQRHHDDSASRAFVAEDLRHILLMRLGRVYLAIDAMAVHATLSNPVLERSILTRGACLGVIDHGGCKMPAIDLLRLTEIAPDETIGRGAQQAFVMRLPSGRVAFLVDEVVDVLRLPADRVLRLATFVLPRGELFSGTISAGSLPQEVIDRLPHPATQFFMLNGEALAADEAVGNLAATNTPGDSGVESSEGTQAATLDGSPGRRNLITYALAAETATPIDQVQEILSYNGDITALNTGGPLLGMLVNRGRSIPVLCLNRLIGGGPSPVTPDASVLVVASQGELVGFAVQSLGSIESSNWSPTLPAMGREQTVALAQATKPRELAQVGTGAQARMLPVLDLQGIARALAPAA